MEILMGDPLWLVAVDPGIRGSGVAVFSDGALFAAHYVKSPAQSDEDLLRQAAAMASAIRAAVLDAAGLTLVVELPRIYSRGGGKTKGDPNDLRGLCLVAGGLAALFPGADIRSVEPAEWKGQVPKGVMGKRVRGRLCAAEAGVLARAEAAVAASLRHNAVDAVGIGLWALGRLERRRAE